MIGEANVRTSGTGEECARAIWGADNGLLEDLDLMWVLVNGEALRERSGSVAGEPLEMVKNTSAGSGAVTRRVGHGRNEGESSCSSVAMF